MGGWTFAKGKNTERTVLDVVTAGSFQAQAAAAWTLFTPGEYLFISEADGSEPEFLGMITESLGNTVTFTLPVLKSKDSDAVLWKPSSLLSLQGDVAYPVTRTSESGVTVHRSLAGDVYAVRTGVASETIEIRLKELTSASERAVRDWLDANSTGGMEPFTIIGPDREMNGIRMFPDGRSGKREPGGRNTLALRAWLESPGGYK